MSKKTMNQEDIDNRFKDSKMGDEVVLDVRLSDLQKGINIRTCRKIIFMVRSTLQIELEIDPNDVNSYDDKYILFSNDPGRSYYQELTVKDDKIDGDQKITLEYDGINDSLNYSMKIDLGSGYSYFPFKDVPYSKLAYAGGKE
jgi:hypothetical protein